MWRTPAGARPKGKHWANSALVGVLFIAVQMLTGGALIILVSLTRGEFAQFRFSALTGTTLTATSYLLFVTITGFLLFTWLQQNSVTSTLPNTVSYVSPVVAVLLGWTVLNETLTLRMVGAIVIIIAGVIFIVLAAGKKTSPQAAIGRASGRRQ